MSMESEAPARLSMFKVQFDGAAATSSKKIYANGNMQVRLQVSVSAVDGRGKPAMLPPSIYHSIRLIDYKTGKPLSDGWEVNGRPNRFAQALYGVSADWKEDEPSNPYVRISTFWVSSSVVTDIQIGAVVIFNDTVIRTNNTTVGNKFDSSVGIEAEPPVMYELSRFRLEPVVDNPVPQATLTHFYLSLNVDGRQIKLAGWSDKVDAEHGIISSVRTVFNAHGFYLDSDYWWRSVCVIAGVDEQEVTVLLPPEQDSSRPQRYTVPVNNRTGALSIVQGVGLDFTDDTFNRRDAFYFTVFDVYGSGHDLCLSFDRSALPGTFILEKA